MLILKMIMILLILKTFLPYRTSQTYQKELFSLVPHQMMLQCREWRLHIHQTEVLRLFCLWIVLPDRNNFITISLSWVAKHLTNHLCNKILALDWFVFYILLINNSYVRACQSRDETRFNLTFHGHIGLLIVWKFSKYILLLWIILPPRWPACLTVQTPWVLPFSWRSWRRWPWGSWDWPRCPPEDQQRGQARSTRTSFCCSWWCCRRATPGSPSPPPLWRCRVPSAQQLASRRASQSPHHWACWRSKTWWRLALETSAKLEMFWFPLEQEVAKILGLVTEMILACLTWSRILSKMSWLQNIVTNPNKIWANAKTTMIICLFENFLRLRETLLDVSILLGSDLLTERIVRRLVHLLCFCFTI